MRVLFVALLLAVPLAGCFDGDGGSDGAVLRFRSATVDDEPCGTGGGAPATGCHLVRLWFHNEGAATVNPTDLDWRVFTTVGERRDGYGTHARDAPAGGVAEVLFTVEAQPGERVETIELVTATGTHRVRIPPYD